MDELDAAIVMTPKTRQVKQVVFNMILVSLLRSSTPRRAPWRWNEIKIRGCNNSIDSQMHSKGCIYGTIGSFAAIQFAAGLQNLRFSDEYYANVTFLLIIVIHMLSLLTLS